MVGGADNRAPWEMTEGWSAAAATGAAPGADSPVRRLRLVVLPALLVAAAVLAFLLLDDGDREAPAPGRFELVGHEPLFGRGMNSALALHRD